MSNRQSSLVLRSTLSQSRDAAMRQAGLDPRLLAIKPGTRRQADKRALAVRGHCKHKGRQFDC